MSDNAKPDSGCTGPSDCYAENIRKVYRCIGMLNSMVRSGERHSDTSARVTVEALDALACFEQHNASVSISGDEPEYDPGTCSLWRPASEPPKQTEWVIASANDAVRCVAWNNDDRRWEGWDNSGFDIDNISWWMSIPLTPDKANAENEASQ